MLFGFFEWEWNNCKIDRLWLKKIKGNDFKILSVGLFGLELNKSYSELKFIFKSKTSWSFKISIVWQIYAVFNITVNLRNIFNS